MMKKEIIIFLSIFLILSLVQHPDFLSSPVDRITQLPKAAAYGLGVFHPIVFALIPYVIILIIRALLKKVKQLFNKNIKE